MLHQFKPLESDGKEANADWIAGHLPLPCRAKKAPSQLIPPRASNSTICLQGFLSRSYPAATYTQVLAVFLNAFLKLVKGQARHIMRAFWSDWSKKYLIL
jgi:hypothetical protein